MDSKLLLIGVTCITLGLLPVKAGNWPQHLGPQRNGVAENESDIEDWSSKPPTRLWNLKVGSGFSGPVVKDNKLYLYHRLGTQSVLDCLELQSGKALWRYQHPTQYRDDFGFDDGPRATPCIHDDCIYLMSADGILTAVQTSKGKQIWAINAREKWDAGKGFFGRAPSPIVYKNLVIYVVGGQPKAGIIALDRATGKIKWTATSDQVGYASPVLEAHETNPILWSWMRESIHGLNPSTGQIRYSHPFRASMNASVNAATPLILPEGLFLSASYGAGGILLKHEGADLKTIWSGDIQMSNHYATCVYHDGYLYGFHGRQEFGTEFRCIKASTGKVQWTEKGLSAGSIIRVNERLLIMLETGELIMASVNSDQFQSLGRTQILPSGVRAFPAYSNELFIARSPEQLVCWALGSKQE